MMTHFLWFLDPLSLSSSTIKTKLSELDPSEKKLDLRMWDFFFKQSIV